MSYSLTPGYRVPAVQRGLSPAEALLTKINAGVGGAALLSTMTMSPPAVVFATVGAAAVVLNLSPGPRSVGRWATVGYRRLRERTAPQAMTAAPGETVTWTLHPDHGTMQDPARRSAFHGAFDRALVFAAGQARSAGIQIHATHDVTLDGLYATHAQTISLHVPRGLATRPARIIDTVAHELAALGDLQEIEPEPILAVVDRGRGWCALEDGSYAATARVTGWPEEAEGDLMAKMLLPRTIDRSFSVLYRPLPAGQSRRSAKWQRAASAAFTLDQVARDAQQDASATVHGALVDGAALVDLDAYLTVWGDSPEAVLDARDQAHLAADRARIRLDWLTGQQHRAHVMTTPHGASTKKGAIL